MRGVGAALLVAIVWTHPAAAGGEGAGVCARCHADQSAALVAFGGHAPGVSCEDCHRDRRPNRFGESHRSVPRCATHHEEARHPPRAHAGGSRRNCLTCHDVHGDANLHLVRPALRTRGRLVAVAFTSESGAAPGGFTDPTAPGTGLCEVCHRQTDFYRADGSGEPHFTDSCIACHDHDAGFAAVVTETNCGICHAAEAARFAKPSAHAAALACGGCHAEVSPTPGDGHRRLPACAECHADRATHAPAGHAPLPCTQCHDPHGTDNTHLVLEAILTTGGAERPIRFDNVLGRAEGSFASASSPGSGICEVCHTQTRFYRADGTGEDHFTFSCLPCHRHAGGFEPQ